MSHFDSPFHTAPSFIDKAFAGFRFYRDGFMGTDHHFLCGNLRNLRINRSHPVRRPESISRLIGFIVSRGQTTIFYGDRPPFSLRKSA